MCIIYQYLIANAFMWLFVNAMFWAMIDYSFWLGWRFELNEYLKFAMRSFIIIFVGISILELAIFILNK